jgi:hypothetical protein
MELHLVLVWCLGFCLPAGRAPGGAAGCGRVCGMVEGNGVVLGGGGCRFGRIEGC